MIISNFLTQNYGNLAYIDIILIIIYMLICLYIGAISSGKVKTLRQYALGTGPISTMALVATMYATHLGAGATIGILSKIAEFGLPIALITIGLAPIQWLLSILIFGNNIEQFRGCITINDIMYRLYGTLGKIVTCIADIVFSTALVAAQAVAFSYCLVYFLNIPFEVGVLIGTCTITFYSVLGGVRAVIVTDILQFAIFYIVIPMICGIIAYKAGGWNQITSIINQEKPLLEILLDIHHPNWLVFLSYAVLYKILPYNNSAFIQRYLIASNPKQLNKVFWIVILIDISVLCSICLLGLILSVNVDQKLGTKAILWHMLNEDLFIFTKGIAVIGILAIIMSTADSYLNISGVMLARNIFKEMFVNISDSIELKIARISTIAVGTASAILALYGENILSILWIGVSFSYPIITVPLISGFLGFRTNVISFGVASIMAIIGSMIGYYIQGEVELLSLIFGCIGSASGLFVTHYIQKGLGILYGVGKYEKAALKEWYKEQSIILGVAPHKVPSKLKQLTKIEEKKHKINYQALCYKTISFFRKCFSIRMKDLILHSQRTVTKYGEKYYEFAFFGLLFCIYPLIFLHSTYELYPVADQNPMWYGGVVLRIFGALGCISIILHHKWQEENVRKYMPLYFHFMAMFVLPTISTYAYLVSPNDESMLIGGIIAIFSLPLLVDWLTFSIITPFGILLGHLMYMFVGYELVDYQQMYEGTIDGSILYVILAAITVFVLYFIESKKTNQWYIKAHHDALTKLNNRHYLNDHLEKFIQEAKARDNPLSIIALDIDHFKKINDTYGHDVGDMVLQHLSRILITSSRPLDICARLGGEEFIIVLPNTTTEEAKNIADRLREKVKQSKIKVQYKKNKDIIQYTVSIGVASLKSEYSQDFFMKLADNTLYKAKRLGRDRVEVFVEDIA